eukprot:CAMPEP_0118715586 /NCGR_PEP_ID=MMETSP0800-20121206/26974_1 /TAXON_ID=210618 ORGANISM="Striatella unipunctata, Strain CCMP2910" /NCGR_SAMPLE_ID=MMETSP0800 /ASSEMBLY_ACC=CAM_ASM_000638 /LENGTH=84 /DNA_ID=CAMNT_0006621805 /DNA_START=524 /DNA_END=775 /DNA_ORIENTATION=+
MGNTITSDDAPLQCFNAAKVVQLGWFTDRHILVDALNIGRITYKLIGFADYPSASGNEGVLLRFNPSRSSTDFFVHFNRATGNN